MDFDLEISRDVHEADWKMSWPDASGYQLLAAFGRACDVDLSTIAGDQLSITLKVLMLGSTVEPVKVSISARVGLSMKYSDRTNAYERVGIYDLPAMSSFVSDLKREVGSVPKIEKKSQLTQILDRSIL
jgi:hypothetical protein